MSEEPSSKTGLEQIEQWQSESRSERIAFTLNGQKHEATLGEWRTAFLETGYYLQAAPFTSRMVREEGWKLVPPDRVLPPPGTLDLDGAMVLMQRIAREAGFAYHIDLHVPKDQRPGALEEKQRRKKT